MVVAQSFWKHIVYPDINIKILNVCWEVKQYCSPFLQQFMKMDPFVLCFNLVKLIFTSQSNAIAVSLLSSDSLWLSIFHCLCLYLSLSVLQRLSLKGSLIHFLNFSLCVMLLFEQKPHLQSYDTSMHREIFSFSENAF